MLSSDRPRTCSICFFGIFASWLLPHELAGKPNPDLAVIGVDAKISKIGIQGAIMPLRQLQGLRANNNSARLLDASFHREDRTQLGDCRLGSPLATKAISDRTTIRLICRIPPSQNLRTQLLCASVWEFLHSTGLGAPPLPFAVKPSWRLPALFLTTSCMAFASAFPISGVEFRQIEAIVVDVTVGYSLLEIANSSRSVASAALLSEELHHNSSFRCSCRPFAARSHRDRLFLALVLLVLGNQ